MKKLIEVVNQYQDSDGRVLSEPFYQLPTRKELPDYYEIIKRPVDIAKIEQRIDNEKYEDLDAMERVNTFMIYLILDPSKCEKLLKESNWINI